MDGQSRRQRRRSPLHALYAANAISFIGNNLTNIAIPWFVLVTTGSAAKTGITLFFSITPIVIAGFFGGTLVDRLGYKRTSIISDLASGVTVAGIAALHHFDLLSFPILLALVFLGALLDAPGGTARAALVPELAELGHVPIERASASIQVVERGSRLIGAPLGGVLIAVFGPAGALWIDALTFAVSAGLVYVAIPVAAQPPREVSSEGYLADLTAGLAFIRRDRLIFAVVGTVMVTNLLDAIFTVCLPFLAKEVYDSSVALGLMAAASGGGAVVGAIAYGAVGRKVSRRAVFIPAFAIAGARGLPLALLPAVPVAIAVQAVVGLAAGPLNPILSAVEYERIPAHMRGRVFGAIQAGAWLAMPLGVLMGGILIEQIGLPRTFLVTSICYLVTTLTMVFNPAIRDMDRRPEPVELTRSEADTPVPA
jgi:MFS family permease